MKRLCRFVGRWVGSTWMKKGQTFSQDLGRSTWSISLNLWSESFTSTLMFSHGHEVWSLHSPREALKQSGSSAIRIKPMLALSPYPSPVPCSWILSLTTGLVWITWESSVPCLFGACFILSNFLFISLLCSHPVCTVAGRRYRQIAYWTFQMLSENPRISHSPFTLLGCLSPSLWFLYR